MPSVASPKGFPMSEFARTIYQNKYAHPVNGRKEEWEETAARVARNVAGAYLPADTVQRLTEKIAAKKIMPAGRYLYAAGRRYHAINNCFLFRVQDSREGWADLFYKTACSLMTGGGIGVVYSDVRHEGAPILGMGGKCTGPVAVAKIVNEQGRYMKQGGSRRSAIWAGLLWSHPDIFKFIGAKEWDDHTREGKRKDFSYPAALDMTNISVILDDEFFAAHGDPSHVRHDLACDVYWASIRGMLRTGEPGFSVDCGENSGENCRNACTEVTSADDGDMCNLCSLNLGRIESLEDLFECVDLGTALLVCGTLYSKLPVESMYRVREKNRRIGLGLMGVHEWLLRRGHRYGPCDELASWLNVYASSGAVAHRYADKLGISRPVATRSVAPTGTISIIAETTSGVEPIFATALKRRYLDGAEWKYQYVVDPSARRLAADHGVDPNLVEDSLTLAEDVERRIQFQSWLQGYVDHGISSTINLPPWGSSLNNEGTVTRFGNTLLKYLPSLRGITAYPDGARDGQPLVKAPYAEAVAHLGTEFVDGGEDNCKGGVCGV